MAEDGQVVLEQVSDGVWRAPGARIIDRSGERRLPIGRDGFVSATELCVVVDKTLLIADVLRSLYQAVLFCRPRRFGKTLNMTMLKAFLELPVDGRSCRHLFEGTDVWEADGGRWRAHQGAYPVVYFSLREAKGETWEQTFVALKSRIMAECVRHAYLGSSEKLDPTERAHFLRLKAGEASEAEYSVSLIFLTSCLCRHHGHGVVVLIDEYDAPAMAGYTNGYYREVVDFLKRWLTGALKDGGEALAFACLTGVQRISKESIFSDLNNLVVSTALDVRFDERFGFTDAEVSALAAYLGHPDCMGEARLWYDGYRFGETDVYNPWSLISYFDKSCSPDVYWGNTSSNSVVGDLIRSADARTLEKVYALLEPGGVIRAPLDLSIVFPDLGVRRDAVWSMLYLAGYLTTADTDSPNDRERPRRLRIPNREIARLYRAEIVTRFAEMAGGRDRLFDLHEALVAGDEGTLEEELGRITRDSASSFDLTSERACHMLMLGLLFGVDGYGDPKSNREAGRGRFDLRLCPESEGLPLVTVELKWSRDADEEGLAQLAREALAQIAERGYDEGPLPPKVSGRLRWGIAFAGKRLAVSCERVG